LIIETLMKNVVNAKKILAAAIPKVGALTEFSAKGALKYALITNKDVIPEQTKNDLRVLLGDYLG